MRELSVSTQTTPPELATLFNSLLPDEEVGGRPGPDGEVILYACGDSSRDRAEDPRVAIAARVAIDVVLQHVYGMPGAQPLLANVHEQLAGSTPARAGWLAPPLSMLARIYCKTMNALPDSAPLIRILPRQDCFEFDGDPIDQPQLTSEQQAALETLIDRLMQLPCRSKHRDRHG